jgi:peroxiredoxin
MPTSDEIARLQLVDAFAPELGPVALVRGDTTKLAALRGRVVLLEFWATWCGPCRAAMPGLESLHARFGAQGLAVLGVANDPAERATLFAAQAGLGIPIVADEDGKSLSAYGVRSLPTTVLIDRRGVVRDVWLGYEAGRHAWIERRIVALLAEPANPGDGGAR